MDWVESDTESMGVVEISVGVAQESEDHAIPVVVVTINDVTIELPDLDVAAQISMNLLEAAAFAASVVDEAPDSRPESVLAAMKKMQARANRKMN